MKRLTVYLCVVLALLVAVSAFGAANVLPDTYFSVPEGMDLEKYPIQGRGELTPYHAARMGLHPVVLDEPVVVFNFHRNVRDGRFVYETLNAGTVVYANEEGQLIYKADCSNRIAERAECPPVGAVSEKEITEDVVPEYIPPVVAPTTGWDILASAISGLARGLWAIAKFFWNWIVPLALFLLLLGLVAFGLYRLVQAIAEARERRREEDEEGGPAPELEPEPTPGVAPVIPVPAPAEADEEEEGLVRIELRQPTADQPAMVRMTGVDDDADMTVEVGRGTFMVRFRPRA